MTILPIALAAAGAILATSAFGQPKADTAAVQALSDKYFCSACHANERTLVGPAFAAIAKKYQGSAVAPAELAVKVKNGGVGIWGQIPMPPNPTVSDDELRQLIAWILSIDR